MGCCVFKEKHPVDKAVCFLEHHLNSSGVNLNEEMSSETLQNIALDLLESNDSDLWEAINVLV